MGTTCVKKKSISLILLISLVFSILNMGFPQSTFAAENVSLNLDVKSAILMEASTGQIIYEYNADLLLPPASMAKMMTEYLVMESIQSGKISWDSIVTTSEYAANVGGSGALLAQGEKMSVEDLFYSMSIYSGNDASVALAEFISNSEENFAKLMNTRAKDLGLSEGAYFINATGLPRAFINAKYLPKDLPGDTVMTARDAALLAYYIVRDHEEVLEFTKIPSKKLRERDKEPMINWNWMIEANKDVTNFRRYAYPGLDGLKTGHTNEAGYCFTGTAERDGMRLISVVMGTTSESKRFEETQKLLDYGFNNFEKKTVVHQKMEVDSLKTVKIKKGTKLDVPVVTEEAIVFVAPKGTKEEQFEWKTDLNDEEKLVAPIQIGDVLGTLTVSYKGIDQQVNLVAVEDVEKGSWIRLLGRALKSFFADMFTGLTDLF